MHARPFLDRAQERPEHGQELDVARDELGVFHAETVVDVDVAVDVRAWVFEFHCGARERREHERERKCREGGGGHGGARTMDGVEDTTDMPMGTVAPGIHSTLTNPARCSARPNFLSTHTNATGHRQP